MQPSATRQSNRRFLQGAGRRSSFEAAPASIFISAQAVSPASTIRSGADAFAADWTNSPQAIKSSPRVSKARITFT